MLQHTTDLNIHPDFILKSPNEYKDLRSELTGTKNYAFSNITSSHQDMVIDSLQTDISRINMHTTNTWKRQVKIDVASRVSNLSKDRIDKLDILNR